MPILWVSSASRRPWWIYALLSIIVILAAAFLMSRSIWYGAPLGRQTGPAPAEQLYWVGYLHPILVDLTGDGVMDVIGTVTFNQESYNRLAAFDPNTGSRLWMTDPIGDVEAVLAGDKLLACDTTGILRAFSIVNGATVWQSILGERVERICGAQQNQVAIELADERAVYVQLATGQVTPYGHWNKETPCVPLQGQGSGNRSGPYFSSLGRTENLIFIHDLSLPGMTAYFVLVDSATGATVAVGCRTPATAVPQAALYRQSSGEETTVTLVWLSAITTLNPLTTGLLMRSHVVSLGALAAGRLLVPYKTTQTNDGGRVSCLELSTGRILWDVPIPGSDDADDIGGINASEHYVFVSRRGNLDIFRLVDGAYMTTIGKESRPDNRIASRQVPQEGDQVASSTSQGSVPGARSAPAASPSIAEPTASAADTAPTEMVPVVSAFPPRERPRHPDRTAPEPAPEPALAPAPQLGFLTINSVPSADIILDGKSVGRTPMFRYAVAPGTHTIVLVHPTLGRRTKTVTVTASGNQTVAEKFL